MGDLVAERPTYALLMFDADYARLQRRFDLAPVEPVLVPYGRPEPEYTRDLVRLTPRN